MLYIDCQIFQTAARHRGMGRYVYSILKFLPEDTNKKFKRVEILLSKNLQQNQELIETLQSLVPGGRIVALDLWTTESSTYESARDHNTAVLTQYVSQQEGAGHFLITALFQEPTVCVFPENTMNSLIFYDLVPYLYHNEYAPLMKYEDYLRRYAQLFRADTIFTISETVAQDLQIYTGIPTRKIKNIDGAAIFSEKASVRPSSMEDVADYVLLPTGDDPRKNNINTVTAFKQFVDSENSAHSLVITSNLNPNERQKIKDIYPKAIFTGNVTAEEMDWLYQNSSLVLFVSEYEGLGLPILEAVHADKPIVCSDIGVFREISDSFYYCDHSDVASITEALKQAFAGKLSPFTAKSYRVIKEKYTWERTSYILVDYLSRLKPRANEGIRKYKIAVFAPTPDGLSAIGKVVAESHPELSEYFDIDYYFEAGLFSSPVRPNYIQYIANCYAAQTFSVRRYIQYEAVIFHIGNGDFHLESIKNSLYLPGIVVLHDTNLSEAYRVMKETGRISGQRYEIEGHLSPPSAMSSFMVSLVNRQLGVVCHSKYAVKAVEQVLEIPTRTDLINLPTATVHCEKILPAKGVTVGLAGIIADVKGISIIEELARNSVFKDCTFKIFGFNFADRATIEKFTALGNVEITTNLTDFKFAESISALDIFVNFRNKYNGETSLSTLEAMRKGVVVLVRDIGWYSELPDNAVIKVKERESITGRLEALLGDDKLFAKLSRNAVRYVADNHSHETYALGLWKMVSRSIRGGGTVNNMIYAGIHEGTIRTKEEYSIVLDKIKGE